MVFRVDFATDGHSYHQDINSAIKVKVLKSFPIFAQFEKVSFSEKRNLKHKK
tara:strand:- start:1478 stop:1633 length:156 start_codon:yes stop_codon:yes gene_type:complete